MNTQRTSLSRILSSERRWSQRFNISRDPAWASAFAILVLGQSFVSGQPPSLVPTPREVKWSSEAPATLAPDGVVILLGSKATEPEQQAARLLKEFVAKRFARQWPILREDQEQTTHKSLVILGQRATCQRLDELCRKQGIELSNTSPGHDGYVIEMVKEGDQLLVLVGGSNARGVEYGQDTLSQMLQPSGSDLTLVRGKVRDAPVIPWRGRPQPLVREYLRPGELDLYVTSRVNFLDLRGGIYAFEPGAVLNKTELAEAVKEAHRRGLIVYATVNCGVPAKDRAKVLDTFRELLDLGADGLWLSFDDKGPGEDPVVLVKQVLRFGRQRHITGHLIAITPPKGSYPKIATDFNRKVMAIRGMERALWFWTAIPSTEALSEARSIGLKGRPGWWHNWPRLFTTHAYVGVPPLSLGWSAPDYDVLSVAGECLDAVMPWGGNAFGQHHVVPVINWWAWNPARHDWTALQRRLADIAFGPESASDALRFDDRLQDLFELFRYSYKASEDVPHCAPRLRDPGQRELAHTLLAELSSIRDKLATDAPAQSLLPEPELRSQYLDKMRDEVETHRLAADLEYPEAWWPEHQRKVLAALYAGNDTEVAQLTELGRTRASRDIQQIRGLMASWPHVNSYADWWRQRAGLDASGWQALLESRRKSLAERVTEYGRQSVPTATMLEGLRSPPLEWGIGRWQVSNRLLATVLPKPNEQFWGDWLAGLYEEHSLQAAVFAARRKTPGDVGEYAELPAVVPLEPAIPGHPPAPLGLPSHKERDRLALLFFVSSSNKDLFSNTLIKYRWAGYRFIELLWDDKLLWEADLGSIPERGEWFLVRLPKLPPDLKNLMLRLRVEDRKLSLNNYTIAYVGPIRLLQLPD